MLQCTLRSLILSFTPVTVSSCLPLLVPDSSMQALLSLRATQGLSLPRAGKTSSPSAWQTTQTSGPASGRLLDAWSPCCVPTGWQSAGPQAALLRPVARLELRQLPGHWAWGPLSRMTRPAGLAGSVEYAEVFRSGTMGGCTGALGPVELLSLLYQLRRR